MVLDHYVSNKLQQSHGADSLVMCCSGCKDRLPLTDRLVQVSQPHECAHSTSFPSVPRFTGNLLITEQFTIIACCSLRSSIMPVILAEILQDASKVCWRGCWQRQQPVAQDTADCSAAAASVPRPLHACSRTRPVCTHVTLPSSS